MSKTSKFELLGLSLQELTSLAESQGQPLYRGTQLFEAIYRQGKVLLVVRVEGWDGSQRCLLEGPTGRYRMYGLFGAPCAPQATMLRPTALAIA